MKYLPLRFRRLEDLRVDEGIVRTETGTGSVSLETFTGELLYEKLTTYATCICSVYTVYTCIYNVARCMVHQSSIKNMEKERERARDW